MHWEWGRGGGEGREKWRRVNIADCLGRTRARSSSFSDFHLKNTGTCNFSENAIFHMSLFLEVAANNFVFRPELYSQNYTGDF